MAEYDQPPAKSTPRSRQELSRRDLLTAGLGAALAAVTSLPGRLLAQAGAMAGETPKSTSSPTTAPILPGLPPSLVITTKCDRVIQGVRVHPRWLREMIDRCLTSLAGQEDTTKAWAQFVTPGQRILLKFMRLGDNMGTDQPMLNALLASLVRAGHKRSDISVADCPCSAFIEGLAPTPQGWSRQTVAVGKDDEQLRAYLDGIDAIINVPFLADHNLAGLACALMNVSLPLIRHPARFYGQQLHQTIASLCAAEAIRLRVKLTLVNALRCVYEGGPLVDPDRAVYASTIMGSTDMVALDLLALDWVERHRAENHLPTLPASGRPAEFISIAGRMGLGQADLREIVRRTHLV